MFAQARASAVLWKQVLEKDVKAVKDLAIDSLKKVKAGYREGERRKEFTLRLIESSPRRPIVGCHLGSVKVEEFEV